MKSAKAVPIVAVAIAEPVEVEEEMVVPNQNDLDEAFAKALQEDEERKQQEMRAA